MDFDLSKPQKLLQNSVREFLSRYCPGERARELMETSSAFDREIWDGFVDQGWAGLTIPEECGGLELSAVDLAAVAEVMGESCVPGPFLSCLWASATLTAISEQRSVGQLLEAIADGAKVVTVALLEEGASWNHSDVKLVAERAGAEIRITGQKLFVGDAEVADAILWFTRLDGELAIVLVPGGNDRVSIHAMPAIDQTRKLYRVAIDGLVLNEDQVLATGEAAEAALKTGTQLAIVAACAELVGCIGWMLKTTVEYAKTRHQFDRPIGTFQAVQHFCADMFLLAEAARSAAYYGAWAVSTQDPEADRLVSIAKAYCSDAGREVGNSAVQAHGGIGFTWEYDLQLYFKRAKSLEILFGDATFHRDRIAEFIIDRPS